MDVKKTAGNKRLGCERCLRPVNMCYCDLVVEVPSKVRVIILQHPSEQGHPKGTAPLLQRCLSNCEVIVGERFTPKDLPIAHETEMVLVYPSSFSVASELAGDVNGSASAGPALILLDGTWRKSRKILHLNPWLLTLPRISLSRVQSRYRIRKASSPGALSTLEAAAYAIERMDRHFDPSVLLRSFDRFVSRVESYQFNVH